MILAKGKIQVVQIVLRMLAAVVNDKI